MQTFAKLPKKDPIKIIRNISTNKLSLNYNLKFPANSANPLINNWTTNTASCKCTYKFGVYSMISIFDKFSKKELKY